MAKTILGNSDVRAPQGSGSYNFVSIASGPPDFYSNEAAAQLPVKAGTFRNLAFNNAAIASGKVATVKLRKNGADTTLAAACPAGTTGIFSDATHSVAVADGDLICFGLMGDSAVFTNTIANVTVEYEPTAGTINFQATTPIAFSGTNSSTTGTNYLGFMRQRSASSTEADHQTVCRAPGTVDYFGVAVTDNTKTVDTFAHFRVGGADTALVITIPAGTTGRFTDTAHTAVLNDGDLYGMRWDGVGGSGGVQWLSAYIRIAHSTGNFDVHSGVSSTNNLTDQVTYHSLFGNAEHSTTEGLRTCLIPFDAIATNLRTRVAGFGLFGSLDAVLKMRINGRDGDQAVTIPHGTAGSFEDTGHHDQLLAGDVVCFRISAGTNSTGGVAQPISVTLREGLIINQAVRPGCGEVTIAGQAALIQADAEAHPGIGEVTIAGSAPHAAAIWRARPHAGALAFAGASPTLTWSGSATPGAGGLVIQGFRPLVNVTVASQLALMALAGIEPTVRASTQAVLTAGEIVPFARASAQDVLTLAEIIPPAAVSGQAILVLAAGERCTSMRCQLWKITRRDGVVFRFTSLDQDYEWGEETYKACHSLDPSASESQSALGQTGNMELSGIIADDSIREADLYGGLFDDAYVEVWLANFDPDVAEPPRRLASGWTGNLSHGEQGFKMEVLGPGTRLDQQALVQTVSPSCRWNFGDENCGVDREALKMTGYVTRPRTRTQFTASLSGAAGTSQWANGLVRWTSGENDGIECEVKTVDFATGAIVLWGLPPYQPAADDTFELLPGCDRLAATCKLYANYVNFGGFPDVPGNDAIAETPDAKM